MADSPAARILSPADRIKTLAGATVVSGIANAVGDFFSPVHGWLLVALGALFSLSAVWLLSRRNSGPKWLESFFGPDTSGHWLIGRNRRWAVIMMVVSSVICCFTVWKSLANADEGGFLASKIPLVAGLQDKIGIREGLARQGISWDGKFVRQAFDDGDVDTLESFINGGWNITGTNCCRYQIAKAFGDKSWSKRQPLFEMLARNGVNFLGDWIDDDGRASIASPLESSIEDGSPMAVEWVLAHGSEDSLPAYSQLAELYFRHGDCLDDPALEERLALAVEAGLPVRLDPKIYTQLYSRWFAIKHTLSPVDQDDARNDARLKACERQMFVVAPKESKEMHSLQMRAKVQAKAPERNVMLANKRCMESALMEEWYQDMPIPRNTPARDSETVPVNCKGEYAYEMVQAGALRAAIKRMDGYIAKLDAL